MHRYALRVLAAVSLVTTLAPSQAMRIHDVGQGSATLLEFPNALILVDTGGENSDQFDSKDALEVYLADVSRSSTDPGRRPTSLSQIRLRRRSLRQDDHPTVPSTCRERAGNR